MSRPVLISFAETPRTPLEVADSIDPVLAENGIGLYNGVYSLRRDEDSGVYYYESTSLDNHYTDTLAHAFGPARWQGVGLALNHAGYISILSFIFAGGNTALILEEDSALFNAQAKDETMRAQLLKMLVDMLIASGSAGCVAQKHEMKRRIDEHDLLDLYRNDALHAAELDTRLLILRSGLLSDFEARHPRHEDHVMFETGFLLALNMSR